MRRETADARKADARHETIDASQVSRLNPRRVSGLMSRAQQSKISMRFYNDREVRAIWDDAASKWWFSVLDIVAAINHEPDYAKTRNYWKWLKAKLKREDGQLVSATTQLKLRAPDGKLRMTSKINDREMFMKGIDYSYYYEEGE